MATLDQLPPEQRAIIELVVQRERSYDDLAAMLDIPPPRVRQLAREALIELAPVSARRVADDRRGQLADYVLGQQSGAEREATQTHLRRSEAGRAWTSSLVDSLADMYPGEPPEIPEAEAEPPPRRRERARPRERARRPAREAARPRRPARERVAERPPHKQPARGPVLSPEAQAAVRRRRIAGLLLAGIAIAGIVLGIVAISGGGDNKKRAKAAPARAQARVLGELLLNPVGSANSNSQGIAIVGSQGRQLFLIVQAKLPPNRQGTAYEVWLYNSRTDAAPVGAQVTDRDGNYRGRGDLNVDLRRYRYIDVSLQTIPDEACQRNTACLRRASAHSGNSVLRGRLSSMRAPGQGTTGPSGATGPTGPTGP